MKVAKIVLKNKWLQSILLLSESVVYFVFNNLIMNKDRLYITTKKGQQINQNLWDG